MACVAWDEHCTDLPMRFGDCCVLYEACSETTAAQQLLTVCPNQMQAALCLHAQAPSNQKAPIGRRWHGS